MQRALYLQTPSPGSMAEHPTLLDAVFGTWAAWQHPHRVPWATARCSCCARSRWCWVCPSSGTCPPWHSPSSPCPGSLFRVPQGALKRTERFPGAGWWSWGYGRIHHHVQTSVNAVGELGGLGRFSVLSRDVNF